MVRMTQSVTPLRVRLGTIHADRVSMPEALERIEQLVRAGRGGYVVTPNVDHVVIAERDARLREAYAAASLSLVDGTPLVWLARALGTPLPEKLSGSDLIRPLVRLAAERGLSVYLLGAAEGVASMAAERLVNENPSLHVAGIDSPPIGFDRDPDREDAVYSRLERARPDLVLVALGAPKQELLMYRWSLRGLGAVMLGIGAGLDFIAGTVVRAPRWVSSAGLEWLYRLSREPRRLASRYLVRDPAIVPIAGRMLAGRLSGRADSR